MSTPPEGSSALRGASLLVTLQVSSRLLTFFANQLLLRFLTAPLLGLAARLDAFHLTVVFFARESLRVAIQRQRLSPSKKSDDSKDSGDAAAAEEGQAVVNLGYLAALLGALITPSLGYLLNLGSSSGALEEEQRFAEALWLYGAAGMLELLSEPGFALVQARLRFGTRAGAESLASFVKCGLTLGSAVWASENDVQLGVLPFAMGQVGYGACLLLVYLVAGGSLASKEGFSVLPRSLGRKKAAEAPKNKKGKAKSEYLLSYFYRPTVRLASSMMAQSVVKHFLTQGDTLLVSALASPHDQGVYALVNNYGGLLARLLFQPVEESCRAYFSRLLSPPSVATAPPADNDEKSTTKTKGKKTKPPAEPAATPETSPPDNAQQASRDLHRLLKLLVLASTPIATLGPLFARPLLALAAGRDWSALAAPALATYCYYIPLLALNGVSEAFVASVATNRQVHAQSLFMTLFSLVFAGTSYALIKVMDVDAAVGLVWANVVNMACRIQWSFWFVDQYFKGRGLKGGLDILALRPQAGTVLACLAAGRWMRVGMGAEVVQGLVGESAFMKVVVQGAMAVPVVAVIVFTERDFLMECYGILKGQKSKVKTT